jgi:hypothetical protein
MLTIYAFNNVAYSPETCFKITMPNKSKIVSSFCNLLFAFAISILLYSPANATEFLHGFEAIPIMQNMEQISNRDVFFDTPSGRIIETYTTTDQIGKNEIKKFYKATLPELGWKIDQTYSNNLSFIREDEKLSIEIISDKGSTLFVHYILAPLAIVSDTVSEPK